MKLREISELLNAKVRCGEDRLDEEHETAFASDLMSDVLTLGDYNPVILTGLSNMQTIRTHLRDGQPRYHRPGEEEESLRGDD